MSANTKRIDMCNGPIFSSVIKFTIPIIISAILQLFFNAADLIVVGRFCGSNSVAAVGATTSLITLIINFFIGMTAGAGVVISNAIGARDREAISRAVHTVVPLSLIAGAIVTVAGGIFSTPLLRLMSTPDEILKLSSVYLRIYFLGKLPSIVFEFTASIFRAAGDSKTPMKYLSIAGCINLVLNVIFVTVFKMDVAGVAFATALSQIFACTMLLRALINREDDCKFRFKNMRIYLQPLKKILAIGLPSGIQSSIFAISNVIIQWSMNGFGATVVAGNAAAANVEGFVYAAMHSFQHTSLNFTGQNVGANKYDRVKKSVFACMFSVIAVGLFLGTLLRIFSSQILSIYINDNPLAISYGVQRMAYICQFYFLCGMLEILTGAMRGLGAAITSLIISVAGVCGVRLTWIFTVFTIEKFHTPPSLYLSYLISWGACIIAFTVAFTIKYKQGKKKVLNA